MSFGLEIDFLAVAGLVKQIRKSFVGAPEQFKAISDDIRAFSIILHDIEVNCTELGPEQSQEYQSVVASCKRLLVQLKRTLEEYSGVAKGDKTGKRTAIKRVWNRLKWEPDDIRDIRSQISVKIDTLRSLNDQVTSHNIVKLIRHQENTEREATIKWISDINYIAQQNDIFLRCQTGSRKWLFESEIYLEWLRRKGSLLFCPGNAGTGKTFTTAMVVESLRLANDAETLTTYMYCSYQNHTQTIEKLLCSLLRVAFEEADYEADGAVSACKQLRLSNKSISRQHCLTLLQGLFSRFTRVNLIVDALDELPNEVRRPLIYDLLKLHEHPNVSLFVTSRGIPEIQHFFEDCENYTSLEVRSSDEDIRDFLRDNIFQLPNFVARSQKLQDEVIDSVTDASAGMFLLAELYLKSLANIILVGSLRTRLSNLATGSNTYDTLYEGSMLRIGFQGPELEHIAIQMLLVLTCARRPLSSQELSHALSIDESSEDFDEDMIPDMDDLVAACTGLVVLDDTSHIVHLVHKSASEYFERTRTRWFPSANEKMAFICLRYLQIAEKEPEETRGDKAPFFYYAKANWCYHSMESEKEAVNDAAMSDASRTESASDNSPLPNRLAVIQLSIQQMTKEVVDVDSSIVEACHAGHQAWVEQLLVVRNYDMNIHGISQKEFISDDGQLITSALPTELFRDNVLLTIAAARGDYSMALLLLAQGADPNIFNAMGQTPLLIAMMNGFDSLVSLLLDHKLIKPDMMCQHSGGLSTAFLASIYLEKQECFKLLLERSNRRARDSFKRGAMWLAAAAGYNSIISELLKWPDIEIDYTDTDFCGNPLTAAVRGGHEETALLLLPFSKCQSCSHCGITPMHYAVRNRLHNLLERLLKHDASAVDSELYNQSQRFLVDCDQYPIERAKTPLTTAIYLQDAQATQILLPYVDPNQGLKTWRLLHGVVEWGNVEIFELLLKKEGVELDAVDERGQTPFLLAAERGNYDMMNTLIQKGDIQLDIRNKYGKRLFLVTVEGGNLDMVNVLIKEQAIQLDIRHKYGKPPCFLIEERANCDTLNALIKLGSIQSDGRDVLGYVADHYFKNHFPNMHVDCFRILASILDININQKDPAGSTFLHRACSVRPKISIKKDMGIQIFEAELLETNSAHLVAELLRRPNVDVNSLDAEGNTPLLLAVKNHQRDVVRLLLEREDTDVLVQNEYGNDALLLASGYTPMFIQLFSKRPSSMKAEIRPLSGLVPTRYRVDHWPKVLNAEFKEYDESILSLLFHDKRTQSHHRNNKGEDILARVAMTGTKKMVETVLGTAELASTLDFKHPRGESLLSRALQKNKDDEAVDLLIAYWPVEILQEADGGGRTPLSYAVQRSTSKATRSLLEAGVDINVAGRCGKTPLSFASQNRGSDAACLLIALNNIQINISDNKGLTPLMYASDTYHIPAVSALLKKPDVDVRAIDGERHSFLCYLMESYYSVYDITSGLKKELDSLDHCIQCLLQRHGCIIDAYDHSPFTCALERAGSFSRLCDKDFRFIQSLRRYGSLARYFHPGLNLSRCRDIIGLLKILGEDNEVSLDSYSDDRSLGLRVLQLFENKEAYNRRI